MKCYNHHDRDAFGVCKACGKGLCLECIEKQDGIVVFKDSPKCINFVKCLSILPFLSFCLLLIILFMLIVD